MKRTIARLLALTTLFAGLYTAAAQNTAFTYQGRIQDNATNFNGTGLFKFALVTSTNLAHPATATAIMAGSAPYEYVSGFNLTSGGSGYLTAPAVTVTGGGGSGASAQATISGGVVSLVFISPGAGYSSPPTVTIAPPSPNIAYTTYWSNDGTSSAGSEPAAAVNVAVSNGLFTVALGDTTLANMAAISAALFAQPDLQLRIWFNDGVHGSAALSPVQNLTMVPYASVANSASNLLGVLPVAQLSGLIPAGQVSGTVTAAGSFTGALNGDVTGTQGATAVASVGGQTAANIASGVSAANAATSVNTASTMVKRDASGNFSAGSITLAGSLTLPATTTTRDTVYSGSSTLLVADNNENFFAGIQAGNLTTSGAGNTACGWEALKSNTTGIFNTANGYYALSRNTSGQYNTAHGHAALGINSTGVGNTALGEESLAGNTNGNGNTAVGQAALSQSTGSGNIALGEGAGVNITTGGNNIDIGSQGGLGDNGVIRIGMPGVHAATYLTGNVGIDAASPAHKLVVQADDGSSYLDAQQVIIQGNANTSQQLELGYKTSGNYASIQAVQQNVGFKPLVLQPAGGNVGIGATNATHLLQVAGAYCDGNTWSPSSDRNLKAGVVPLDANAVLAQVARLPISRWHYTNDVATPHIGPMAQDFYAAFGIGADDRHISDVDEGGVALAAIQGLNQKLSEKDAEIQDLKQSIAQLKAMVEKLAVK